MALSDRQRRAMFARQRRDMRQSRNRAIAVGAGAGAVGLMALYGRRLLPALTRVTPKYVVKHGAKPKIYAANRGSAAVARKSRLYVRPRDVEQIHTHDRLPEGIEKKLLGNILTGGMARRLFAAKTVRTARGGATETVKALPLTTRVMARHIPKGEAKAAEWLERNATLWNVVGKTGGVSRLYTKLQNAEVQLSRRAAKTAQRIVEYPVTRHVPKKAFEPRGEVWKERRSLIRKQAGELKAIRQRIIHRLEKTGATTTPRFKSLEGLRHARREQRMIDRLEREIASLGSKRSAATSAREKRQYATMIGERRAELASSQARQTDWITGERAARSRKDITMLANREVARIAQRRAVERVKTRYPSIAEQATEVVTPFVRATERAGERLGERLRRGARRLGADVPVQVYRREVGPASAKRLQPVNVTVPLPPQHFAPRRTFHMPDDSLPENGAPL